MTLVGAILQLFLQPLGATVLILISILIMRLNPWNFSKRYQSISNDSYPSNFPSGLNEQTISNGEELKVNPNQKPLYKKLTSKLRSSIGNWLDSFRKLKLKEMYDFRGDGLHSIFSDDFNKDSAASFATTIDHLQEPTLRNHMNDHDFIFKCLFKWRIFSGVDVTLLDELCLTSQKKYFEKDQIIFDYEDASDKLYIIVNGLCSIHFNENKTSIEKKILELQSGDLIAGIVDIAAWILGSHHPRLLRVKASSACEILILPSPRKEDGNYQSSTHAEAFGRIVRMLMVRLSRTTITTAYFYLGIADYLYPSFYRAESSQKLQSYIQGISGNKIELPANEDINNLVFDCIASLFTSNCDDPLTESEQVDHPCKTSNYYEKIIAFLSNKRLSMITSHTNNLTTLINTSFNPTPNQNTDQNPVNQSDSNTIDSPIDGGNKRPDTTSSSKFPSLVLLEAGDSLIDLEPLQGLYIIVTGRIRVGYTGGRSSRRDAIQKSVSSLPAYNIGSSPPLDEQRSLPDSNTPSLALGNTTGNNNASCSSLFEMWSQHTQYTDLQPGAVIGQLSLIGGSGDEWYSRKNSITQPMLTAVAATNSWLLCVPRVVYEEMLQKQPETFLTISQRFIQGLPPVIRLFDCCSKWIEQQGGEEIIKAGEYGGGTLQVLLSGRLQLIPSEIAGGGSGGGGSSNSTRINNDFSSVADNNSDRDVDNTRSSSDIKNHTADANNLMILGRGAIVGGSELLSGEPHRYTVRTLRACTLACVPKSLLAYITIEYPAILSHLTRNVALNNGWNSSGGGMSTLSKSIAIMPISGSVPLELISNLLKGAMLQGGGSAVLLTSSLINDIFSNHLCGVTFEEIQLRVGSSMHNFETENNIVLYQCEWQTESIWNKLCFTQADEILLVANSVDSCQVGAAEKYLYTMARHIPKTLIIVHVDPPSSYFPRDTRKWVEQRDGICRHLHIRLHPNNLEYETSHYKSDFCRLARVLCNCAVGVVLGGGGARGLSHIGVLQALEEANIPIDFIGGTSMGAMIGGLYASHDNTQLVDPLLTEWTQGMSIWAYFQDLTLPITSYFNGYNFSRALKKCFGTQKIEDFWLTYFCITTDLTTYSERVHVNGTAWRYIRATMSLASLLPPVCDVDRTTTPYKCHYLVDGGYVNNLPADIMKQRFGAQIVISVDVSGNWNLAADTVYKDWLNGLSILLSTYNPFMKTLNVPSMTQISTQLAYVSASNQLKCAKQCSDLYLRPPLNTYTVFDINKYKLIRQIGYSFAKEHIDIWRQYLLQKDVIDSNTHTKQRKKDEDILVKDYRWIL